MMRALQLQKIVAIEQDRNPLVRVELSEPQAAAGELKVQVEACAVGHTELDQI
ncbi:MAG: hypothetical protein AAGJ52_02135 [Pseudomonadota bacterium]